MLLSYKNTVHIIVILYFLFSPFLLFITSLFCLLILSLAFDIICYG